VVCGVEDEIKVDHCDEKNPWQGCCHLFTEGCSLLVGEKKTANMAFLCWSSERGDVTKHLEDAGISVTSCRLLKKEKWQEKFSAFKVVVGYNYVHKDSTFEAVLFSSSRHG